MGLLQAHSASCPYTRYEDVSEIINSGHDIIRYINVIIIAGVHHYYLTFTVSHSSVQKRSGDDGES